MKLIPIIFLGFALNANADPCEVTVGCSETTTLRCSGAIHCYVRVCDYLYCDGVRTEIGHCPDCPPE